MFVRTSAVVAGWVVAAAFLAVGVPLFLRMPLWCDATLYDVAARTMLASGVHYRDVFDTNPPGFPWLLCGVRVLLGPSPEAVRGVDLGIVAAAVAFLLVWTRRAGASHAGIAWAAAACAAFYPFTHEFNHAQRDVWMMLPAALAIGLRLRRLGRSPTVAGGVLEGLLWGVGCWVKPHLLFIAAAVWLVTAGRLGSVRGATKDLAAVVAGGLVAGLSGLAWLVGTGAWPHFLDTWRNWNTSYADIVRHELPFRVVHMQLGYFPPYSGFALLAVPLALWNLRGCSSPEPARFRRAVLAAVYLAWLLSALLLQRPFHYVHIPETLLMLALFAANRWPVPFALVLVQLAGGAFLLAAAHSPALNDFHHRTRDANPVYRHLAERNAAFAANRTRWWAGCFDRDPPRELRRGVGRWVDHFGGHDPVQLGAVADYLRTQNVRDGELIAWHDSPHALYLELGVRPGFRFMHVGTVVGLGPWQREQVLKELQAALPHARFAVSDMHRITAHHAALAGDDWERLLPVWQRSEFPFDQPVVFRSPGGRYLVHRIDRDKPVTSCAIPERLDQEKKRD
jgi:hypothetical protein